MAYGLLAGLFTTQRLLATSATNADHAVGENANVPPSRSLVSRTNTRPGWLSATSTQEPPLVPLRVLFRQFNSVFMLIDHSHHQVTGQVTR